MEINEIKKELYKQNPEAWIIDVTKSGIRYFTQIRVEKMSKTLHFNVPLSDIGDASFDSEMPAKLLIRYLI